MRFAQLFTIAAAAISASAFCIPSVRREWRTLTRTQKKAFLDAVKCLSTTPHDPALAPTESNPTIPPPRASTSYYDDLVYIHMDLAFKIHATGFFLPWHRLYIQIFENALKDKCGFQGTLPYWDWTQDAADFQHATIFDPDPEVGFGSWGTAANDYQITDGALAGTGNFKLGYPVDHALRRNYTERPYLDFPMPYLLSDPNMRGADTFTATIVNAAVNGYVGDYKGFAKVFSDYQGPHAGPHLTVGADLKGTCPASAGSSCTGGETWSPNDPLFFLHHAMVDKLWFDWQWKSPFNYFAFEGGATQALGSLASYLQYPTGAPPALNMLSILKTSGMDSHTYRILDVISTISPSLCYVYA